MPRPSARERRARLPEIHGLEIIDIADKGRGIARHEGQVVFVEKAVPGDVCSAQLTRQKKAFAEGVATTFSKLSPDRREPFCIHFEHCGGCRWQHLSYEAQLAYKQKQVQDALERIGHVQVPAINPILGSERQTFYRNKLEFTFSNRRWLTNEQMRLEPSLTEGETFREYPGLGYHLPGQHDRLLDIKECWLQPEPSNSIRNWTRQYTLAQSWSYRDLRLQNRGWLRNLVIRNSSIGQWMVIIQVAYDKPVWMKQLTNAMLAEFPMITTLGTVINGKLNESFYDLDVEIVHGPGFIEEHLEDLRFTIGPKSFFQTNTEQALELYRHTRRMAALTGNEIVYDLYSGTGTIGLFVAHQARQVIGIEYVEEAIEDAQVNANLNGIKHAQFFAGDMAKVLDADFIAQNGSPDVVITDPPRAGMATQVVEALLAANPKRIVYVSCNPATQARDLAMMDAQYDLIEVQPVDMFPHTDHVENIIRLDRRT